MFLPYLMSFKSFAKTPIVYCLFLMNLFGMIILLEEKEVNFAQSFLFKEENLVQIGEYYQKSEQFSLRQKLENISTLSDRQKMQIGLLALRDSQFSRIFASENESAMESIQMTKDEVLSSKLKNQIGSFFKEQKSRLSFSMGLNNESSIKTFITYQLSHAGFIHFFSNMIFLVALGLYLEILIGSFGLLCLYFLGGIAGGIFFNLFNSNSFVPMIGASGAVSAMLAFMAFHEYQRKVRFIYFLSPLPNHHGTIYLPVWWIIPLFLISDVAQLISAPAGVTTGVAYAAHVGGAAFGMVCALLWRQFPTKSRWAQILDEEYSQSQQLAP
ncbi:MAG: rhomboid family intramembrane serine protease [Pseudobdellovibrionaceae bacterium]